jgi:hypothetical protein
MNSRERRFWQRIPDDLKAILAGLPSESTIQSFEPFGRSWKARVQCVGRQFEIVSSEREVGYIHVSEIVAAGNHSVYRKVMPPDDQMLQITPAQVCELVLREWAELNAGPDA